MADYTPRSYFYGMIAFIFVIVSGLTFMAPFLAENPGMTSDPLYQQFGGTFNKTAELTAELSSVQSSIEDAGADPGPLGFLDALVKTSWTSMKALFNSLTFMNGVFNGLVLFGAPAFIPALIILVVITMIAFTIWSAIFQSEL